MLYIYSAFSGKKYKWNLRSGVIRADNIDSAREAISSRLYHEEDFHVYRSGIHIHMKPVGEIDTHVGIKHTSP